MNRGATLGLLTILAGLALGSAVFAQDATTSELIARGQYLATAADCSACHTAEAGKPFAGGKAIDTPLGKIFASNITPSKTDGIGDYSEDDFSRALRKGIRKDGAQLYPAMPYTAYAGITDVDIKALYAYFTRGVEPVDQAAQKTVLPFPFSIRASMIGWNLLFLNSTPFTPDPSHDADWNRGAYLAQALAHCSTCHTPRNALMAEESGQAFRAHRSGPGMPRTSPPTRRMASGTGRWHSCRATLPPAIPATAPKPAARCLRL
jgi:mono/diheme cytochrome c family protein